VAAIQVDLNRQGELLRQASARRDLDQQTIAELERQRNALQERKVVLAGSPDLTPQKVETLKLQNQQLKEKIKEVLASQRVE
jgi:hypothetical protein